MQSLKQARTMVGLSQFFIARETGIDRARLSMAENCHINLRPEELAAVKRVLLQATGRRISELDGIRTGKTPILA